MPSAIEHGETEPLSLVNHFDFSPVHSAPSISTTDGNAGGT